MTSLAFLTKVHAYAGMPHRVRWSSGEQRPLRLAPFEAWCTRYTLTKVSLQPSEADQIDEVIARLFLLVLIDDLHQVLFSQFV